MGNPSAETLITSAEACQVLNIDRSTLNRWIASGRVTPTLKLPGKTGAYLFAPDEIEKAKAAA